MKILYVKTPPTFEAEQFLGGREQATHIGSWLADHEIHSAWYDSIESITVESNEDGGEPVEVPSRSERLALELPGGDITISVGTWIVLQQDNKVELYSAEAFPLFFTEKK